MAERVSLYYEIHVTIEFPYHEWEQHGIAAFDEWELFAKHHGWHMGNLLLMKKDDERSRKDLFFTERSETYEAAEVKTRWFIGLLQRRGYTVLRYKIEDTVLDSRINDEWRVL